ncbi:protease Do-like 2 [Forsythia ovata]|uniref:Protease Do-like 2 n=1 Tax=Forsythia ovata TaxID=205694 RepID=A0ABD1W699_9LAMI
MAAANCWFSVLTSSTGSTSRYFLTSQRLFSTSRRPTYFLTSIVKSSKDPNQNQNPKQKLPRKTPDKFSIESEDITQKFPGRSRDKSPLSNADGRSSRKKAGRSQSTSLRSSGVQRKGNNGVLFDSKDQHVYIVFPFIGKKDMKFKKSQLSFDLAANGTLNPQLVS